MWTGKLSDYRTLFHDIPLNAENVHVIAGFVHSKLFHHHL